MQSKLGANNENETMAKTPLSYVIVDYSSLTEQGIRYFRDCAQQVVIVTTNKKHIALNVVSDNIRVIQQERLDLKQALHILKRDFKCEKLTVQAGGEITKLLKEKDLVDFIDLVVAPVIIGGNYTSPLFGGDSIDGVRYREDLTKLQLEKLDNLGESYYRVRYKVKRDK